MCLWLKCRIPHQDGESVPHAPGGLESLSRYSVHWNCRKEPRESKLSILLSHNGDPRKRSTEIHRDPGDRKNKVPSNEHRREAPGQRQTGWELRLRSRDCRNFLRYLPRVVRPKALKVDWERAGASSSSQSEETHTITNTDNSTTMNRVTEFIDSLTLLRTSPFSTFQARSFGSVIKYRRIKSLGLCFPFFVQANSECEATGNKPYYREREKKQRLG